MPPKAKQNKQFTICIVLFSIIAASVSCLILENYGFLDGDFYWHVALGKYILNNGMMQQDKFSWLGSQLGLTETAHSWLSSVIISLFAQIRPNPLYGCFLYIWVTNFIYMLTMLSICNIATDTSEILTEKHITWFSLVAASILLLTSNGRPQQIGNTLFLLSIYLLLDAYQNPDSKKCYALPIISTLWANLHGGSLPILFAYNGLFVVLSLLKSFEIGTWYNERPTAWKQRTKRMAELLLANLATGLLNPYGYKLYYYFCVTNNTATKKYVSEWQNSTLINPIVILALIFLFATAVFKNHKVQIEYPAVVLSGLLASALYVRCASYLSITLVLCTAQIMKSENILADTGKKTKLVPVVWIVALMTWFVATFNTPSVVYDADKTADKMSDALIATMTEMNPQRLYTDYSTGGIAIYHGFQSFIDARADLFPAEVLTEGIQFSISKLEPPMNNEEYLKKWNFDAILLNNKTSAALIDYMNLNSEYEKVFEDSYYTLYRLSASAF